MLSLLPWTYGIRVNTTLLSYIHCCLIYRLYAIIVNLLCLISSIQCILIVFNFTLSFVWRSACPSTGPKVSMQGLFPVEFMHPIEFISFVHILVLFVGVVVFVTSWRLDARYNLKHFFSVAQSLYRRSGGVPPDINTTDAWIARALGAMGRLIGCRLSFTPFMRAALRPASTYSTYSVPLSHK